MIPEPEEIDEGFLYNPYVAMVVDKDDAAQEVFFKRFYALPQPTKDFLTAIETTQAIQALFEDETLPDEYAIAVAKIVAFVAMGDVPVLSIEQLLLKLNLSSQQARTASRAVTAILDPLLIQRAKDAVPAIAATEMPPMTRPMEKGPQSLSPAGRGRNIIDLRKKQ